MTSTSRHENGENLGLLKFGCFFLTKEGEVFDKLASADVERLANESHRALLEGARASPLVKRIVDPGMPEANWSTSVDDKGKMGVASGLLTEVVFEALWPARNWPGVTQGQPDSFIIALNGLFYAVFATVPSAPFEDSFELGRQAQACLQAIYSLTEGFFVHSIGPTPMWPAIYLTHGAQDRTVATIGEQDVLVRVPPGDMAASVLKMVSDSSWAITEHYLALQVRSELIHKDLSLDSTLQDLFSEYKAYSAASGLSPGTFFMRQNMKRELKMMLSLLYEEHADAMKLMSALRRCSKESRESFGKLPFLLPFVGYTAEHLDDMLEWTDSHVLQAARFLEEEVRSRSLEQITLIAALAGALAGVLVGGLVSFFA